jgi:hypothetical protein
MRERLLRNRVKEEIKTVVVLVGGGRVDIRAKCCERRG